ncbi:insulin-like peptide receptor isoform X2 [Macrosteles quadrilineatus]|uniref:insulin-like peptide receptor isoform X2 n=1 Tax=Macrosteles quadrilineatus TaxID=74068 RepID=UPI0023E23545|nr:insulin-like peptide receptor isoform X2 [Macrosteles quadrilineatus]
MEEMPCRNIRIPLGNHHHQSGSRSSTCYGSGDDVSWRWHFVLVVIIVLVLLTTSAAGQRGTEVALANSSGVCQSRDIRNSVDQFNQLIGCRVIEGFLQIVLIDKADPNEYENLSFPELREVTGYILLYRVNGLRSLGKLFPNLSVIRGNELFFDYALVAFEMLHLQELGLSSLTDIMRGGVYFVKNPMLCYIDTIDWDLIAKQAPKGPDAKKEEIHFIRSNKKKNECPICPKECMQMVGSQEHLCWSPSRCQKVCPSNCTGGNACNSTNHCCHENCLGGCFGPTESDCYACRGVLYEGKCINECPPDTFKYMNRRCVTEQECHRMPKPRQTSQDIVDMVDYPWKPFIPDRECILQCPAGYLEEEEQHGRYVCKPCQGYCKKECSGASVDSIAKAQKLRDCTFIKGSLEIQIRGGINVVKELEENLKMIEEIQGYLKIVRSFPLMSLNFLKKLRVIHGEPLESGKYALVVLDNQNLMELWDWETKGKDFQIRKGRLFFHFNPKLCIDKIHQLKTIAHLPDYNDMEVAQNSNGDKVACNVRELEAMVYKTSSKAVLIKWKQFSHYDSRTLLGYVVYTIEAPYQNITMYDGRDACGGDGWRVDDVSAPEPPDKDTPDHELPEMQHILTQLQPYTQYAFYVKTYTIATEKVGAQSKIQYFRTFPDIPTVPRALKAYSNSSSELVIHWNPPAVPNGNVTQYIVRGTWEHDDQKFLEQRNYCNEPLALSDKSSKPSTTKVEDGDVDKYGDDGDVSLSKYAKEKECACKKDDKEEKEKKQKEKEIQFQIHFEDALHNQVYVKRKNVPEKLNSESQERPQREKREIQFRDEKGNNEFPSPNKGGLTLLGDSKNKNPPDSQENFEYVVGNSHMLVVRNLRHFAHYTISVTACRELTEDEKNSRKNNNCSAQAILSARTQPLSTADNVKQLTVIVLEESNHTGDVLLKWDEPPNPNGLIVTYQIEYRRIDIENYKPTVECITRLQFHNMSKSYILKNLGPGNYSVKVRATSLAGNGNYTESAYFDIKERRNAYNTQLFIAFILCLGLLSAFAAAGILYYRKQSEQNNPRLFTTINPEYVSTGQYQDECFCKYCKCC